MDSLICFSSNFTDRLVNHDGLLYLYTLVHGLMISAEVV